MPIEKMKKKLRTDLILEGCETHPEGCYIRFRELKKGETIVTTGTRTDAVIDRDVNGKIIGIEFYQGLKNGF